MIILGPGLGDMPYAYSTTVNDTPATVASKNKTKHLTILYNTFIFLQVFNEINCRKIGRRDFNVFERMLTWGHNWYFISVFVGTFAAQILMCEWGALATIT